MEALKVNVPRAERLVDLFAREFPENPSYINPMVLTKGGTLLLGGEAKVGKSFIMLELCRALATGTPFMDNRLLSVPEPVKVLYVDAEVGERTNKARGLRIFQHDDPYAYANNIYHVSKNLELQLDTHRGVSYFGDLIRDVRPNVLVLDPISFLHHGDENSARDVGSIFLTLARLKERGRNEELSIVFSHHFRKPPFGQYAIGYDNLSEYNFRGSSKWKDGGDTILTMQRTGNFPRTDGDEAWKLKLRFLCRHGPSAPEGEYAFNKNGDLRIVWRGIDTAPKGGPGLPPLKAVEVGGRGKKDKNYPEDATGDLFEPAQREYDEDLLVT